MSSVVLEPTGDGGQPQIPWYRGLSGNQWFVLIVCWLGWLFDTMDQQLFVLARNPALTELLKDPKAGDVASAGDVAFYAGIATMFLVFGWATGGIIFGILGDRWGRAKTLIITVFCYSIFTGLSAFSTSWLDFTIYRFLTGLGVGGTFGAAVSMVAETLPSRSRSYALGFLQVLAALGNVGGATLSLYVKPSVEIFGMSGWRVLFLVGILPALLVVIVMRRLKEPESWIKARDARASGAGGDSAKMGSMKELFGDSRWRRNVTVGILLGLSGVIGLWGIGFWLPELVRTVVKMSADPSVSAEAIKASGDWHVAMSMIMFNGAAAAGTYAFTVVMSRIGRRIGFAMAFSLAIVSVFVVFGFMTRPEQIWWMAPLLGLGTLTIFGGYSIYFPELFPTRLRASGVGFCYNTARYIAAPGAFALGGLAAAFGAAEGTARAEEGLSSMTFLSGMGSTDHPIRYAAIVVSGIFLVGLVTLIFAPETKDKPLPE